jgi:hypothetical protein
MNKKIAHQINVLAKRDQLMRKKASIIGMWDFDLDKQNTIALKKIIKQYGWPTIRMVGKKASFNAWLLAQHADHDLRFQKKVLRLLRDVYKKEKDIDPSNIAFLTDRILIAEGKKQIFGTQFYITKKGLRPRPIKNIKRLNDLRKQYGLRSYQEDVRAAKKFKVTTTSFPKISQKI